ncbi:MULTISPECIES: PspC domain-containing protein [Corynebacterium]|uniref:PspC domain-containing protein n=3 Tax=Corynebacterium TaxID=1716 RepID=A0A6I3K9V9_9CORY|nr:MULTISPECIES: PspC domain-containing protein [Corynebacterium]KKO81006.1 PspC family transcriptional regulator [Corynebacterium minutissimum]MTD90793.1 PspC domain-containing protein [Corynebacterium aurimucosum]OFK65902.1 PspC family transcriptional regulator [Corynebacterium sp. HMSC076G08]OFK66551.1 PspC family transcriptional regulator [Corynebacterium sp. HMSC074A09]OFN34352.1 PspC family transcriptional regulator [Corynebacterium sp. HMSC072A04]
MTNQRLTRSTTDTMLGGVCGGIAQTYNLDPTLVRILFVVATLLGFSGILLYLILWVVIPVE